MSPRRYDCPRRLVAVLVLLASSRAHAQDVLLDVPGPVPGAQARGASIGDWDGDGVPDLAIGLPTDSTVSLNAGSVQIVSGKDASVLATFAVSSADDFFGASVTSVPDLDGDGLDDLAIGAPGASFSGTNTGSIHCFAARTGATLVRIDGPASGHSFGVPFGPIGDVDGDGIGDLYAGENGGYGEVVHVVSGADGHELVTLTGGSANELFGYSVGALDDLDADGVADLIVGAPYYEDANRNTVGAVYVFSTATGATLRKLVGTVNVRTLGAAVGGLGDLDGDGVRDYALFSQLASGELRLLVYSAATKALLTTIRAPWQGHRLHGDYVSDLGDVNGDGVSDFAIEGDAPTPTGISIVVHFFSGSTFLPLDHVELGNEPYAFAASSTPPFDLDADGLVDVIVTTLEYPSRDGHVRVYAGAHLWQDAIPPQVVAGDTLELATREGVPGALTLLALEELDGVPTFLVVDVLATFDATGGRSLSFKIPLGLGVHDFSLRAYADDGAGRLIQSATQQVSTQ